MFTGSPGILLCARALNIFIVQGLSIFFSLGVLKLARKFFVMVSILLVFTWALPAEASESITLTLSQAIDRALRYSIDFQKAEADLDLAKTVRDETWDKWNAVLINTYIGQGAYISLPTGADPEAAVYKTDFNWRLQQKNREIAKDIVTAKVYKQYYAVLEQGCIVKTNRMEAQRDSFRLTAAEARYRVGMESLVGLRNMRTQASASRAALDKAEKDLEQVYAVFNEIVGLPVESRPVLLDTVKYTPLKVADPDTEIARIVEDSLPVWTAREAVQLQKDIYGKLNSYDVDKINLKKAELDEKGAEEQMRQLVRSLYYAVVSLETSHQAALEGLKSAQEALRAAKLSYELGLVTKVDVANAESALAVAEQTLFALACQHELMKMAFEKPWTANIALGGAGADDKGTSEGGAGAGAAKSGGTGA